MRRVLMAVLALLFIGSALLLEAPAGSLRQEKPSPPAWSVEEANQRLRIRLLGERTRWNDAGSPQMMAIDRLVELGTNEAVDVFRETLIDELSHSSIRKESVFALGKIGTEYAIKAIEEYIELGEKRRPSLSTFRLGRFWPASNERQAYIARPDFFTVDNEGSTWALFQWHRHGLRQLWVCRKTGPELWDRPVLLDCPLDNPFSGPTETAAPTPSCSPGDGIDHFCIQKSEDDYLWRLGRASGKLSDGIRDSDKDGIPDLEEKTLGTNLANPDSDGDGKPDGVDPCPLTPTPKKTDEDAMIRQAVFTTMYSIKTNRKVIYMPEGSPSASDEYRGYAGYILPTKKIKYGFYNLQINVKSKTSDVAKVNLVSTWDMDEAIGWTVTVEKKHGKWVVTDIRSDWRA